MCFNWLHGCHILQYKVSAKKGALKYVLVILVQMWLSFDLHVITKIYLQMEGTKRSNVLNINFKCGSILVEYLLEVKENTSQEVIQLLVSNAIRDETFLPSGSNFTLDTAKILVGEGEKKACSIIKTQPLI